MQSNVHKTPNNEIWPGLMSRCWLNQVKKKKTRKTTFQMENDSHTKMHACCMSLFLLARNNGRDVQDRHKHILTENREKINDYDKHKLHYIFPLLHSTNASPSVNETSTVGVSLKQQQQQQQWRSRWQSKEMWHIYAHDYKIAIAFITLTLRSARTALRVSKNAIKCCCRCVRLYSHSSCHVVGVVFFYSFFSLARNFF